MHRQLLVYRFVKLIILLLKFSVVICHHEHSYFNIFKYMYCNASDHLLRFNDP